MAHTPGADGPAGPTEPPTPTGGNISEARGLVKYLGLATQGHAAALDMKMKKKRKERAARCMVDDRCTSSLTQESRKENIKSSTPQ